MGLATAAKYGGPRCGARIGTVWHRLVHVDTSHVLVFGRLALGPVEVQLAKELQSVGSAQTLGRA